MDRGRVKGFDWCWGAAVRRSGLGRSTEWVGDSPRNRAWTRAKAAADGCAESMATLTLRTETVTRAPILRSLSRNVPAMARARRVPMERVPEGGEEDRREGGEEEPELVGGEARGRGPVGEQVQLLLLDRVLHVAPRAGDALVDGPGREGVGGQRGHDEAGVSLARQVFRLRGPRGAAVTSSSEWRIGTPCTGGPGGRVSALSPGHRQVPSRSSRPAGSSSPGR